jgi:hypothetical protein
MLGMLDRCQIPRDTVTLVFDKGSAALANTVELHLSGIIDRPCLGAGGKERRIRDVGHVATAVQKRPENGAGRVVKIAHYFTSVVDRDGDRHLGPERVQIGRRSVVEQSCDGSAWV